MKRRPAMYTARGMGPRSSTSGRRRPTSSRVTNALTTDAKRRVHFPREGRAKFASALVRLRLLPDPAAFCTTAVTDAGSRARRGARPLAIFGFGCKLSLGSRKRHSTPASAARDRVPRRPHPSGSRKRSGKGSKPPSEDGSRSTASRHGKAGRGRAGKNLQGSGHRGRPVAGFIFYRYFETVVASRRIGGRLVSPRGAMPTNLQVARKP